MAAGRQYWLVKSEPDSFSWNQQVERGIEPWTGVRNFRARANLQAMKQGDLVFFYHSNEGREIVGVVEVVREAYPDPSVKPGEKGEWVCCDMQAISPFPRPVTLAEIKADPQFAEFELVRLSRLSVAVVSPEHWKAVCKLGGWKAPRAKAGRDAA